jgi:hypothetical protein
MTGEMAIRLLATYEFIDKDGRPAGNYPQGHAVVLVPDRDDSLGSHSGPVSTHDLPGQARYRREDASVEVAPAATR